MFIFSHTHGSVAEPAAAINTKSTAATTTTTTIRERERDGKRRAMERYVKLIRHKINFKLCA